MVGRIAWICLVDVLVDRVTDVNLRICGGVGRLFPPGKRLGSDCSVVLRGVVKLHNSWLDVLEG